jgi:type VI secretion system protein ImpF
MAKIKDSQPLVPSVLDRLLDDEPEVKTEAPRNRTQLLRQLKQSVRRDLENLLNTRQRVVTWPPSLKELDTSILNYGIPEFTGANMATPKDREDFCKRIERIIQRNEPRFKSVKVKLIDNTEQLDRTLRFRIDAMLYADPAPEPVYFDSTLKPATGTFDVADNNADE